MLAVEVTNYLVFHETTFMLKLAKISFCLLLISIIINKRVCGKQALAASASHVYISLMLSYYHNDIGIAQGAFCDIAT